MKLEKCRLITAAEARKVLKIADNIQDQPDWVKKSFKDAALFEPKGFEEWGRLRNKKGKTRLTQATKRFLASFGFMIGCVDAGKEIRRMINVLKALDHLECYRDKHIISLHYLDNQTWSEVAESTGYKLSHVHRLHREAKKKIESRTNRA